MKITIKVFRIICIFAIVTVMGIPIGMTMVDAEILLRNTFEDYEGSLQDQNWIVDTLNGGRAELRSEDPSNNYASQAHGDRSLLLKDDSTNSKANARHSVSIPDTADEYMIEFYFWATNSVIYSHFPLMVPWHLGSTASAPAYNTDISIFLEDAGDSFEIQVRDADSLYHNVAFLDTTNRWYKFQIHRKPNSGGMPGPPVVDFYLDGEQKGEFDPLNPTKIPNEIRIGTTDTLDNGEGFWDDVIVTTTPTGEHPRLLFDSTGVEILRARSDNVNPTTIGPSFAEMWDLLQIDADKYLGEDSFKVPYGPPDPDSTIWIVYPY